MKYLAGILINGFIVYIVSWLLPGVYVEGYLTAVWVGLLIGLINSFIKPVIKTLTIPLTVFTLGIFLLILNGLMILLADALVGGFDVNGLFMAIIFSIVLSIFNYFFGREWFDAKELAR